MEQRALAAARRTEDRQGLARADLKDEDEKDEGDTEEDEAHALYYTIGLLSRLAKSDAMRQPLAELGAATVFAEAVLATADASNDVADCAMEGLRSLAGHAGARPAVACAIGRPRIKNEEPLSRALDDWEAALWPSVGGRVEFG